MAKFKKGSPQAKAFMAKLRAARGKKSKPKKLGATLFLEQNESKKTKPKKKIRIKRNPEGTFKNFSLISGLFDESTIKSLDDLKKQYYSLAKKYHPDAGGSTLQFQELQRNYDKLFKDILNGGTLNKEQQNNEVVIDKAIRDIIDSIIILDGITIEVVGRWLWVGGNTFPVKSILKESGLLFIKKDKIPYWVYKGSESTSRGKMSMEDIKSKYGSSVIKAKPAKRISGLTKPFNKTKLKNALKRLTKGLCKRSVKI